jgi:putative ABC transport system permease protein
MTTLYKDYFRFPLLQYQLSPEIAVLAVGLSLLTAALGAFAAVHRAVSLPPAEAMRPEAPAKYRESVVERLGLKRFFSEPVRMVMRNLERHPLRALMSVTGIALGSAIMVVGTFFLDSIDLLLDVQFNVAQRQDVTVSFVEPASARAFYELERLPGVLRVERSRAVLARLRFGNKSRQVAITGLEPGSQLARVVDAGRGPVGLPPTGLVLSAKLAELLGVQRGDTVIVEVLEGSRPVRQAVVTDLVKEYMGTSAYMDLGALERIMREEGSLSGGFLQVDQALVQDLYRRLKATPAVAGVSLRRAAIQSFRETIAQTFDFLIFFNILFSVIIAFGVVYNAARILLSERNRELATLRVMGFERGEVSFILLGELAMLVLIGIPLGLLLGYELAALIVRIYDTELYRFPLVISVRTYLFASTTVLVAAVISGLITRRKLDRLDLVAVLKARE